MDADSRSPEPAGSTGGGGSGADAFDTYEDYLDSQITATDVFYLEDVELARQLVELGCAAHRVGVAGGPMQSPLPRSHPPCPPSSISPPHP